MSLLGASSFVGGLCESLVLVIVTLTADSLIRSTDEVTFAGFTATRTEAILVALALVVVKVSMTLASSLSAARFSAEVMNRAQSEVAAAYLGSSHEARSSRHLGDLAAVIVGHGRFTGDLANSFTMVASAVCGLVAFGGTSLVVNPLATIGIAVIGGLLLLLMRPLRQRSKRAADSYSNVARKLSTEVTEVETLHREIEIFQVRQPVADRLNQDLDGGAKAFARVRFLGAMAPQLFQATMLGAAVLSLLLVANNPGERGLAAIGAVVLLLIRSMSAAQQLVMSNQRVLEFGSFAAGLTEVIASLRQGSPEFGSERPPTLIPIELDHVGFTYDGETAVLNDLTTTIRGGELIGVVGPSGAGKSTLVELLLRLRQPSQGTISCNGTPIDEIDPSLFGARVAYVPQHAVLIKGTVAENIDFFRGLPEHEITEALKRAHLTAEVDALPEGINTRLGPDDRALSGGQRQRLTIARALAGRPEILVLDEPTSALDAVSENAIRDALTDLPDDLAVVIVAHRYSTLRSCDRILVLRNGLLDADATPQEVAQQSQFFRTMIAEGATE